MYQGEDPDALKNTKIGNFMFEGLNQEPDSSEQGILLTYSLDLDGILSVHALERSSGQEIRGVIQDAAGRSSAQELVTAKNRLEALWGTTQQEESAADADASQETESDALPADDVTDDTRDVLLRAQQALPGAAAEDREEMVQLIRSIRAAASGGRMDEAAGLTEDLREILFFVE